MTPRSRSFARLDLPDTIEITGPVNVNDRTAFEQSAGIVGWITAHGPNTARGENLPPDVVVQRSRYQHDGNFPFSVVMFDRVVGEGGIVHVGGDDDCVAGTNI